MSKLQKCPFCGSENTAMKCCEYSGAWSRWRFSCRASGPEKNTYVEADELWNRRKNGTHSGLLATVDEFKDPDFIMVNDRKEWRVNGKLHREDGPAVEYKNGGKEWWVNGRLHREDGPAVENGGPFNGKEWWVNGRLHREDGPAMESTVRLEWWVNGQLHRINNPAVVSLVTSYRAWWICGQQYREGGPAVSLNLGSESGAMTEQYWRGNRLHRIDGPAYVSRSYGSYTYIWARQSLNTKIHVSHCGILIGGTSGAFPHMTLGECVKKLESGEYPFSKNSMEDLDTFLQLWAQFKEQMGQIKDKAILNTIHGETVRWKM